MKPSIFTLFAAMTLFAALGIMAQTLKSNTENQIITFDAGPLENHATSINPSGEITGWYADASRAHAHGFLRAADGKITTLDVGSTGTTATSINPSGEVTGWYFDANFLVHSFLREH